MPDRWNHVLPKDWIQRLDKKYRIDEIEMGDHVLNKIEKNYRINGTLFLFIGRGIAEATDRFYIMARNAKVDEIIFLGTCASLVDDLDTGDINIPRFVLPWEDMSAEYVNAFEAIPKANESLVRKITETAEKASRKYGIKVANDNHATVELFYGETVALLGFFRQMNISTIDMELSALYRLSAAFDKKAVGILRVGDRPLHKEEYWSNKHKNKQEKKEQGKEVILRIIESLIK